MLKSAPFESRMQNSAFALFLNIFLAVIIFYNAELGRLLGIPGPALAISVIWPATGISLAALVLFGFKTCIGIFLGNFCYNGFHLLYHNTTFFWPFVASLFITLGSLGQALMGASILQRYSSANYFTTVKDVLIFLFPAGLLSCLVASSVGTVTLYFYGSMTLEKALTTWLTFWVGDTMGVYIFTPLLVVWTLSKPLDSIYERAWQIISMVCVFAIISYGSYVLSYPLTFFYIPLAIWVAFCFRMHGATLAVFLISTTAIIPSTLGYGVFVTQFMGNYLFYLVVFLEVIVGTSLLVAAVINEREAALHVIVTNNLSLQQAAQSYQEELKEMSTTLALKDKISALGVLTLCAAKQLPNPIHKISKITKNCLHLLKELENTLASQKGKIGSSEAEAIEKMYKELSLDLVLLSKYDSRAQKIAKAIQELSMLVTSQKIKAKTMHVNTLVNVCLIQAMNEMVKQFSSFNYTVTKEFDRAVSMLIPMPEDFAHALVHLFGYAITSMKEKRDRLGDAYAPTIDVQTRDRKESVEIVIKDNGNGVTKANLEKYSYSFLDEKLADTVPVGQIDFTLCLVHDIVTFVHRGHFDVQSKEGESLQVTIVLPKS